MLSAREETLLKQLDVGSQAGLGGLGKTSPPSMPRTFLTRLWMLPTHMREFLFGGPPKIAVFLVPFKKPPKGKCPQNNNNNPTSRWCLEWPGLLF